MSLGTKHVGVRRIDGSRAWETYDRETGSRIGTPLPTRYEAQSYAEHRQATTYGDVIVPGTGTSDYPCVFCDRPYGDHNSFLPCTY